MAVDEVNQIYQSETLVLYMRHSLEWGEKAFVFNIIELNFISSYADLGLQLPQISKS